MSAKCQSLYKRLSSLIPFPIDGYWYWSLSLSEIKAIRIRTVGWKCFLLKICTYMNIHHRGRDKGKCYWNIVVLFLVLVLDLIHISHLMPNGAFVGKIEIYSSREYRRPEMQSTLGWWCSASVSVLVLLLWRLVEPNEQRMRASRNSPKYQFPRTWRILAESSFLVSVAVWSYGTKLMALVTSGITQRRNSIKELSRPV